MGVKLNGFVNYKIKLRKVSIKIGIYLFFNFPVYIRFIIGLLITKLEYILGRYC